MSPTKPEQQLINQGWRSHPYGRWQDPSGEMYRTLDLALDYAAAAIVDAELDLNPTDPHREATQTAARQLTHTNTSSTETPKRRRQTHRPRQSEKAFQAQVAELAGYCGWRTFHPYDSRRSTAGFPDLCLLRPPRLLFVELKTERGRIRPEQQQWLDDLALIPGVERYLWRPSSWPEITEKLSRTSSRAGRWANPTTHTHTPRSTRWNS